MTANNRSDLPDFELAPFTELEPSVDGSDPADGLILLFASAFNDLKAYMWLLSQFP